MIEYGNKPGGLSFDVPLLSVILRRGLCNGTVGKYIRQYAILLQLMGSRMNAMSSKSIYDKNPQNSVDLTFAMNYIMMISHFSNNRKPIDIISYLEGINYMKDIVDINQISYTRGHARGLERMSILDYLNNGNNSRDLSMKQLISIIKNKLN